MPDDASPPARSRASPLAFWAGLTALALVVGGGLGAVVGLSLKAEAVEDANVEQDADLWDRWRDIWLDDVAPATPAPIAPADGSFPESRNPTFRWSAVSDPSGLMYVLEYSHSKEFPRDATKRVANLYEPIHEVSRQEALPPLLTVYWRVMAFDGNWNGSEWSEVRSFTPLLATTSADVTVELPP